MFILAYVDVRQFFFIVGLPLFIGFVFFICSLTNVKTRPRRVALIAGLIFIPSFLFFFYGPFIGQTETREYMMTWRIEPIPSKGQKEAEVVLSFVDFPNDYIGAYSDKLASHLKEFGAKEVKVVFEVTLDYGEVRGFDATEIAGLPWKNHGVYAGGSSSSSPSPWD